MIQIQTQRRRLFGWGFTHFGRNDESNFTAAAIWNISGEVESQINTEVKCFDEDGGRYSAHFVQRGGYAFTFSCHAALSTVEDASADDSSAIDGNKVI